MTGMIQAFNALWGPDPVEFHGKFFEVPASIFNPKPVQKPRPPLLLGGSAPAALARAARMTDGSNPVAGPNASSIEQFFSAAQEAWNNADREPNKTGSSQFSILDSLLSIDIRKVIYVRKQYRAV